MSTALPELHTPRLRLRELVDGDTAALFGIMSDPRVMRHWSRPPFTEPREAAELIAAIRADVAAGRLWEWGLTLREGGALLGTCTLYEYNARHRRAEIGFALAVAHWGSGLMGEAARAVLDFAFASPTAGGLDLERLEADTDPRNAASIALLERLGFQREGVLRRRWCVAGEWSDSAFYGLLRKEWEEEAWGASRPGLPTGRGRV